MRLLQNQSRRQGRMRIMALATVQLFSGKVQVLDHEVAILTVVTIQTNVGHGHREQCRQLRFVRQMTEKAISISGGFMRKPNRHSVLNIRVTREANTIGTIRKQTRKLSVVRQVAEIAITIGHGPVSAIPTSHRIVAGLAEGGHGFCQKLLLRRRMRQVAGIALPLLEG